MNKITNKIKYKYQLKGFTLIELAVVLLVIGILATLLIRNFGGFTGAARDTRRIADIRNVSVMLSAYYVKLGRFPTSTYAVNSDSWKTGFANELINLGIIAAPGELVNDPSAAAGSFYKYYACDRDQTSDAYSIGSAYILVAKLEAPTTNDEIYKGSIDPNQVILCNASDNTSVLNSPTSSELSCWPSGRNYCLYNY